MKKKILLIALAAILALPILASCAAKSGSLAEADNYSYSDAGDAPAEYDGLTDKQAEQESAPSQQKLIKRYNVSAETKVFDETLTLIDKTVSDLGGYFEKRTENNAYGKYDARMLNAVIRIPEDKAESFLFGIKGAANVKSFTKTADNVTEAYVDSTARLQTLEAEREGLLNMISSVDNAKDYEFWLTLHRELSDKEQDIAALKAKLRNYDNLISYSTFNLDLAEVKEYTEPEKEKYGSRISAAFTESWERFAENFKDFTVGLVRALPTLITLAVVSVIIFLCIFLPVRASVKKRRKAQNVK
ncbi:MAG: DUF4349 domain-containing protein [Clostridia bacterium]|nr:DUF4349 domain-containing protein [Clostridia bacterium]